MLKLAKKVLASTVFVASIWTTPLALADASAGGDSSSDAPAGFTDMMNHTRGVVVRVPVNARGEENTNAAELRFYQGRDGVTRSTSPTRLWRAAIDPGHSRAVLGRNAPNNDASTWGWYNWYGLGWAYPYYYSYYYPTFYYANSYWSYAYYWNWGWGDYRYYYYYWW